MGKKGWTHTSLVDYFMTTKTFQTWFHRCVQSLTVAQSLTVDPSFSDLIWSFEAMTIYKQVLIPIYEMSAKEIEGYIKCFDVNVQTWVIIIRTDQYRAR